MIVESGFLIFEHLEWLIEIMVNGLLVVEYFDWVIVAVLVFVGVFLVAEGSVAMIGHWG